MTDALETVVDDLALIRNHANPQECLPGPCRLVKGEKHARPHIHQTHTSTPSLLSLLQDAITASIGGTSSGRSLAFERSILDAEALEQAARITASIDSWCHMVGVRAVRADLGGSLIAWREAWNATHPNEAATAWYVAEMRSWVGFILSKLDRPKRESIELPCPVCKATHYDTEDGNRDTWPIKITWREGAMQRTARATCAACGTEWPTWEAIVELRNEYAEGGNLDEAAHAEQEAIRLAIVEAGTCSEEVTRKGELQPCDKPAVGLRNHPEHGPYPVCGFHARSNMVTLEALLRAVA